MKRREVIKNLSILPVSGAIFGSVLPLESALASPAANAIRVAAKRDLFKELGIRTFINAAGTITMLSGSTMYEEVIGAIISSSGEFAAMNEVQDKVGAKIAGLCHAEAAFVTAGCWSAIVMGTAGALTEIEGKRSRALPNVEGRKSEVIIQKIHSPAYANAVTNAGAKIVTVETADDVEKAVNENTAMMLFMNYAAPEGKILHEEWVALGKKFNIPNMIDIAADVPPVENLWKYNDMGFDMVCISGGKGLRGPQSAGILMGKKNSINAARQYFLGGMCRGMKINKEEILGMYVALEKFIKTDHEKEWKMWEQRVSIIENTAKKADGVITRFDIPPVANHTPTLNISWDAGKIKLNKNELSRRLRNGNPSIEVQGWNSDNSISLVVFTLRPGDEKIMAKRIFEELTKVSV